MARMIALALAALAIAGTAAPSALAETRTSSVRVSYSDLDLGSAAGASALLSRLDTASRRACLNGDDRTLTGYRTLRACMKKTMADTVARLNAPMVLAMFAESKTFKMASR